MMLCKEKIQKQPNGEVFALNILVVTFNEISKFFICLPGTSLRQVYGGAMFHLLFLVRGSLVTYLAHISSSFAYMGPGYDHLNELW